LKEFRESRLNFHYVSWKPNNAEYTTGIGKREYLQRPAYQQNDYIGWITRVKLPATRQKRLEQMLDELFRRDVYMKMAYCTKK
jgi:Bacteriocin-protection, YdeI or OmpD-Associated